jgi:hypothetical protein
MYIMDMQVVLISAIESRSVQLCTTNFEEVVDCDDFLEKVHFSFIWWLSACGVYRSLVLRSLQKKRGRSGGGCSIEELHFRHWLGFCYLVMCLPCLCIVIS